MKTFTIEIEQRGRASAHVYAESEADARKKVAALLDAQQLESEMITGWDEEAIIAVDELAESDGFDKDQAKENEEHYQEIIDDESL